VARRDQNRESGSGQAQAPQIASGLSLRHVRIELATS
jgi:hypothetical protein